jgi:phosphoribosyl 1,2-cyclic phosphate phosphodiesterase
MNDQNKYPGAPSVLRTVIDHKHDFTLEKLKITPIKIMHYQLEVMGYRFGNFAYLTDVKTIEDEEFEKLNSLDVLVLSALRIEPHPSHLNLEEALAMVERIQPKKTYFTHISHLLGFHDEVEANLPNNVHLAFDNLQITSS